ncbi:MAG TPA: response regulator [Thermoanaerobaculia bacterium]|nr:response regulator [Thermoanaerobaculia bacterium]
MSPITIVIAEEEKARRATCQRILTADRGIRVIAEAGTAAETLATARLAPRILLVDSKIALGHHLVPMFRRASPKTRVIVLTGQNSGPALLDALAQGAHGVLNRRLLRALLIKAIRRVAEGESWVPRKMIPKVMESLKSLPANDEPVHARPRGSHLSP